MKTFNELTSRSSSKAVVDEMESDNGLNSKGPQAGEAEM